MAIKGNQKPKRNKPCPCGSELKYKWCHGDMTKTLLAREAMNRRMAELIIEEKIMRGLLDPPDIVPDDTVESEPESNLIIRP